MSVIRRHRHQALDSLRSSLKITEEIDETQMNLQELKNAAKMAAQAAEILNRLVGLRMAQPVTDAAS